jgi:hypothetical protein
MIHLMVDLTIHLVLYSIRSALADICIAVVLAVSVVELSNPQAAPGVIPEANVAIG